MFTFYFSYHCLFKFRPTFYLSPRIPLRNFLPSNFHLILHPPCVPRRPREAPFKLGLLYHTSKVAWRIKLWKLLERRKKYTCLICSSSTGSRDHRHIRHLNWKIIIIYEWPGPFHFACLEVILESSKVRISEQATKKVIRRVLVPSPVFSGSRVAMIVTRVMGHFRVCGGCGSVLRTVPLAHEVTDTQHSRMVY